MLHNAHAAPTQSLPPFAGAGLLQVLLWVPPLQAVEQAPNRDHPPSTSASHMSKSNDQSSLQASLANAMFKTIFIKYILHPGPSTQSNTDLPGQACVLHTLVASPTQSLPPFARAGLLHVLVSVPPPQLFEHAPKPDHPPSSVLSPLMPSATQYVRQQCHDSRFF